MEKKTEIIIGISEPPNYLKEKGSLYINPNNRTIILCTESSTSHLFKGIIMHSGAASYIDGKDFGKSERDFSLDGWDSKSFKPFFGALTIKQNPFK